MSQGQPASGLHIPLERLQRLVPRRDWQAIFPAELLSEEGTELRVAEVKVATGSEVALDLVLDQVIEGVLVLGSVTYAWSGDCARCVQPVQGTTVIEIRELFETEPDEGETYLLGNEYLDLLPMVRDAVLLELPIGAVPCPFGDGCPHAPPELLAMSSPEAPEVTDARLTDLADLRWAALDELVFDDGIAGEPADGDPSRSHEPTGPSADD